MNGVRGLILSSDSPEPYDATIGTLISFHFEVEEGEYPPTNAEVLFNWGDGTSDSPSIPFAMGLGHYEHRYFVEGLRNVSVNIRNPINAIDVQHEINVAVSILGMDLVVKPRKC